MYNFKFKFDTTVTSQDIPSCEGHSKSNVITISSGVQSSLRYKSCLEALFGGIRNYIPNGVIGASISKTVNGGRKSFIISSNKDNIISWKGNLMFNTISTYENRDNTLVEARYLLDTDVRGRQFLSVSELFEQYPPKKVTERLLKFMGVFTPVLKQYGIRLALNKEKGLCIYRDGNLITIDDLDYELYLVIQTALSIISTKSEFYVLFVDASELDITNDGILFTALGKFMAVVGNQGVVLLFQSKQPVGEIVKLPSVFD